MLLCLDVGNTQIYGGIIDEKHMTCSFRYPTKIPFTSDQFGIFIKAILENNDISTDSVRAVSLCSVVPNLNESTILACEKYLNLTPFIVDSNLDIGLKLQIDVPSSLGTDRIATSVAAISKYPKENLIVIDFGTATTICAISKKKEYVGGAIIPGIKTSLESLSSNAAQLNQIQITPPENTLGKNTKSQIQMGLYYSQLGAIKMIIQELTTNFFQNQMPKIIATGGYASLFKKENLFTDNIPDLVLHGLKIIFNKNNKSN